MFFHFADTLLAEKMLMGEVVFKKKDSQNAPLTLWASDLMFISSIFIFLFLNHVFYLEFLRTTIPS